MYIMTLSQSRTILLAGLRGPDVSRIQWLRSFCSRSLPLKSISRSSGSSEDARSSLLCGCLWNCDVSTEKLSRSQLGNYVFSCRQYKTVASSNAEALRLHHSKIQALVVFTRNQSKLSSGASDAVGKQELPESSALIDPYQLVQRDLSDLSDCIKRELACDNTELSGCSQYHFDGAGKYFRPMVVLLMARACNLHSINCSSSELFTSQKSIALISEMIHTASLVHDDVIDTSDIRRGRTTLQKSAGQRKAILAGDYILSVATRLLARIGDENVVCVLSQVLEDLVSGEFMQLGSKEDEGERFNHYMRKTFKKTASLIANSCKAVAMLGKCPDEVVSVAYEYGRNVGIAFQLVDDLLDYISTESVLGKPAAADLHLGLATAPVLFAAELYPDEINPMIMRRFAHPGDVHRALQLVAKSEGVAQTRYLAVQHVKEAVRQVETLGHTTERQALVNITQQVINRVK